jgi:hypothetical protein
MSSAELSASRFGLACEAPLTAIGDPSSRRSASSTTPRPKTDLSTKVEYCPGLVDNRVDSALPGAYLPTSAPPLRPVDG